MSSIAVLSNLLGLSFVSGINLYATVLVVGLGARFGWFHHLSPDLEALSQTWVLVLAGVMYGLEFFADKVPFITPVWDSIHTFVRPLGAAALAYGATQGMNPALQIAAALLGGSIGLGVHSTKMGTRLLAHATPEPVSHSIISVLEDAGVVALVFLVQNHPWIAVGVLLALIGIVIAVTPMMMRMARLFLSGLGGLAIRLCQAMGFDPASRHPSWLEEILREAQAEPTRVYCCFNRSMKGAPKFKQGYLITEGAQRRFIYRKLTGNTILPVNAPNSKGLLLIKGALYDTIRIEGERGRIETFYLTKEWSKRFRDEWQGSNAATEQQRTASA